MCAEFQQMPDEDTFGPSGGMDADLEKEINEALGDMSLDEMMAEEDTSGEALPEGVRKGRVAAVQGDDVFVEFGGKDQGVVPVSQFGDEDLPEEGTMIEVTVEGYNESEGLLQLSRKGAIQAATWDSIEKGQVVEGFVYGMNKGGLEVRIQGVKAFMPISQIDLARVEELEPYLNQKMQCKVIEVDRKDKKVVVSRRSLMAEQAAEAKKETLATLEVGQEVEGKVRSLMPYGAFVDIGGVDGLIHISDLSHGHVDKPQDVVAVGDQVKVKVLKIDRDKDRIGLGLKQTQADPWAQAAQKWPPETVVTGRITRLADFGAFIELEPGVEGLIPISEMSWSRRVGHPKEIIQQGDTAKVYVMNVDPDRKRMSLSLKRVEDDPWMGASVRWPEGTVVDGRVTRTTDFGAFVELAPGVEGLVHISELASGFVESVASVVTEGDPVQVRILNIDEEKRRIGLSMKQADPNASEPVEEDNWQQYLDVGKTENNRKDRKRRRKLKGGLE
jgi:small subunit ribosomal protein S1